MSTPRSKEKATGLKEKPTGTGKTAVLLSEVNVGDDDGSPVGHARR